MQPIIYVKHLVFYGSSCVYPKNCPQPMKEEHLMTGLMKKPASLCNSKTAGYNCCRSYNSQFNSNCFIALIPNQCMAKWQFWSRKVHVLSALIRRFHEAKIDENECITLWGSGNPRREFIFCEDVADASIFAVANAEKLQNSTII